MNSDMMMDENEIMELNGTRDKHDLTFSTRHQIRFMSHNSSFKKVPISFRYSHAHCFVCFSVHKLILLYECIELFVLCAVDVIKYAMEI